MLFIIYNLQHQNISSVKENKAIVYTTDVQN